MARKHMALAVDFGGVLTTDIWVAFAAFSEAEGLDRRKVKDLFREEPEALRLLRELETARLRDADFERDFAALLGLERSDGLIERMFAGLEPDEAMIEALRAVRAAGLPTGLISNSWGLGIYERAPTELFDVTVISGEVGLHKPQPEIYLLACEQLAVAPTETVFVDDLRENCAGAEAVGMTAVLHRDSAQTIAKLERLLELELSTSLR
jgi:putative hydrolase of the HAD superfamily